MTVVGADKKEVTGSKKPVGMNKIEQADEGAERSGEKKANAFDDLNAATPIPPTENSAQEAVKNSQLPGAMSGSSENKGIVNNEKYDMDELVITGKEKSAFIDAMLTGERYKLSYPIFGGKINVTIRSRTSKETQAMYAYIRHEMHNDGGNLTILEGDMQYLLLVAQIEELNGTKYPEMKIPLTYTESDGKTIEPGWLEDLASWKDRPEGLISAIINRVQLFEYKYWTMVKEASNKNFWNSDTSIVE